MRRLPSPDGVELVVHDLAAGGGGAATPPHALLVHATGFCAAVFSPLASDLAGRFACCGVDLRGHGRSSLPSPPGTEGIWAGFTADILAVVDGLGLDRPVGIGHSSGGAALLSAEAARPGTFAALWCYEPIVWPEPDKARDRAERLAAGALRRRNRFASRQEAFDNYRAKPPFSMLAEEALAAYVDCGLADDPDGSVVLRCRPEVEAAVYVSALDEDRFRRLPEVACPVVVASGARSDAITPERADRLAGALPDGRLRVFDGLGHFGPLENPALVARAILADLV